MEYGIEVYKTFGSALGLAILLCAVMGPASKAPKRKRGRS
jgi:hypothetical protein